MNTYNIATTKAAFFASADRSHSILTVAHQFLAFETVEEVNVVGAFRALKMLEYSFWELMAQHQELS
jgi:hypothetical protein